MKKVEIIWREMLFETLERGDNVFVQQDLAKKFGFSTSTVFQALKPLRKMGAVKVGGRKFMLQDPEKLLYHWASVRDFNKDIIYQTKIDLPVLEIESQMPNKVVFGAYSAYRLKFKDVPADYDQVIVYIKTKNEKLITKNNGQELEEIKKRFPFQKGRPNLMVLKADLFLSSYGQLTTLGQTFVDLWNQDTWYAKEFILSLKQKINELLS